MPSCRRLLFGVVAAPLAFPIPDYAQDVRRQLCLAPNCDDDDDLTPPQAEGRYFSPQSAKKQDSASGALAAKNDDRGRHFFCRLC